MANLEAATSFNYENLDLSRLVRYQTYFDFYDNFNAVLYGNTYPDLVEFQFRLSGITYAGMFGGNNVVFNNSQTQVLSGTATGYLEAYWTGSQFAYTWGINDFAIPATSLANAIYSTSTSDDFELIAAVLSGDDLIYMSEYMDTVNGFSGDDSIYGNGGDDLLHGDYGNDLIFGGLGRDTLIGGAGYDFLDGGSGNDAIDGGSGVDTVTYSLSRTDYEIDVSGSGYTVHALSGLEGLDTLVNVEKLQFDDMTVDLTMRAQAQTVTPLELQTLQELYVGFFNRVPEANGLSYWISEINEGATLRQVADQFYSAGVQFGVYSADMTEAQFITTVYANVLGRTGESAPDNSEIGYWQNWLHTGTNSKGAMVLQMLNDSHNFFTGDPVVGWVIDLLDNKAAVANYFAVEQGISYNTPEESIARGIEIAAAITPTDITEAITLIGIADEIV